LVPISRHFGSDGGPLEPVVPANGVIGNYTELVTIRSASNEDGPNLPRYSI
jgi:hypothetical protein